MRMMRGKYRGIEKMNVQNVYKSVVNVTKKALKIKGGNYRRNMHNMSYSNII